MALEKLSAPWFPMYENLSAVTAPMAQDLTKRLLNQLVMEDEFFPSDALSNAYANTHTMLDCIRVCRRVAYRELIVRLGYMERDPSYIGDYDKLATDCERELTEGLRHCQEINVMKIMGAILHPLFQNKKRMISSSICRNLSSKQVMTSCSAALHVCLRPHINLHQL